MYKYFSIFLICSLVISLFSSCQQDKAKTTKEQVKETEIIPESRDTSIVFNEDAIELDRNKTRTIKQNRLLEKSDEKRELKAHLISKKFYKEEDDFVLDYTYPYFRETSDTQLHVFNNYISETYLNIEKTENEILEDKTYLCDTLKIDRFKDERFIDYKIYTVNNDIISVLLYKENYYSGMKNATYLFDCLNFETKTYSFIYYNDLFIKNSEAQLRNLINTKINEQIYSGEFYYDCWEITEEDFQVYKNNFVLNDEYIEFYFDDCVICPSYTGTYSIQIPIEEILSLIDNKSWFIL